MTPAVSMIARQKLLQQRWPLDLNRPLAFFGSNDGGRTWERVDSAIATRQPEGHGHYFKPVRGVIVGFNSLKVDYDDPLGVLHSVLSADTSER